MATNFTSLSINRMYNEPSPPTRAILDSVSDLKAAIILSLQGGLLKRCQITLSFPIYVFRFLFPLCKGNKVAKKPGRLYSKADFLSSSYFTEETFSSYNKFGEGCFVYFPVYMHSFIKFSSPSYDNHNNLCPRNFTETLVLKIRKTRDQREL